MRIAYVHMRLSTVDGMWGTRARDFAAAWARAGHDVTVITGAFDRSDLEVGRCRRAVCIDGFAVRATGLCFSNRHGTARRVVTMVGQCVFAAWWLARLRPDVALVSTGPPALAILTLLGRVLRIPTVIEIRDAFADVLPATGLTRSRSLRGAARQFEATCVRAAHAGIALSPTLRALLQPRAATPLCVVTNTADVHLFRPATRCPCPARSGYHFVYTGTLSRSNDCPQMIAVASLLAAWGRTDIVLHFFGDGVDREQLAAAARAGIGIRLHQPLLRRQMPSVLGWASGMLLLLRADPIFDTVSPNKLFDALAAGVPVVQTTQGWIREMLAARECGVTVGRSAPAAYARALIRLADDCCYRPRLARYARRAAEDRFATAPLAASALAVLQRASSPPADSLWPGVSEDAR